LIQRSSSFLVTPTSGSRGGRMSSVFQGPGMRRRMRARVTTLSRASIHIARQVSIVRLRSSCVGLGLAGVVEKRAKAEVCTDQLGMKP
jgi:hypothetical protein